MEAWSKGMSFGECLTHSGPITKYKWFNSSTDRVLRINHFHSQHFKSLNVIALRQSRGVSYWSPKVWDNSLQLPLRINCTSDLIYSSSLRLKGKYSLHPREFYKLKVTRIIVKSFQESFTSILWHWLWSGLLYAQQFTCVAVAGLAWLFHQIKWLIRPAMVLMFVPKIHVET